MAASKTKEKGPYFDLGRRIAAARAYTDVEQGPVAKKIGVERQTLGRYERGFIPKQSRESAISGTAEATGLPLQFFRVDFGDLPKMMAAWKQVDPKAVEDAQLRAELLEEKLESRLADERQRSQPNRRRNEGSEPGSESS